MDSDRSALGKTVCARQYDKRASQHRMMLTTANDVFRYLVSARLSLPILLLMLFWLWETGQPFFGYRKGRIRHAARNIALALLNTLVLGLFFGAATVFVTEWTSRANIGLLNLAGFHPAIQFISALVLLDAWMYVWHRANHAVPLLWRFHRMHHSDNQMDVTTATRFHLGEHIVANVLRLGLVPLLGFQIWHIVVYEMMVIAITQFHHADISVGRLDRWLRLIIVTPNMHKIHHSRWQLETDSNFSTFFSFWDRIASTFRMRAEPKTLEYGLYGYDEAQWQTFWGMLKTPFVSSEDRTSEEPQFRRTRDRTRNDQVTTKSIDEIPVN